MAQPKPNGITIRNFEPRDQPWFASLNREWIEEFFWLEPVDILVLGNPDKYILQEGGVILMAEVKNQIAGTVALKKDSTGTYEFTKMAVATEYRRHGIATALSMAAIETAKNLNAKRIILYSNTKLQPALALYKKVGFREVPVDGPYERSDIKMELDVLPTNAIRKNTSIESR